MFQKGHLSLYSFPSLLVLQLSARPSPFVFSASIPPHTSLLDRGAHLTSSCNLEGAMTKAVKGTVHTLTNPTPGRSAEAERLTAQFFC